MSAGRGGGIGIFPAVDCAVSNEPIAVGAAHAQKLQRRDAITVCFFGDGAINRCPFLESLNWARGYPLEPQCRVGVEQAVSAARA